MVNEYFENFFSTLCQLRQEGFFCDVKLQVEDATFSAHRIVLMAGSAYFHAMFANDMAEHSKDIVTILGVTPKIFEALLDFIYTGM